MGTGSQARKGTQLPCFRLLNLFVVQLIFAILDVGSLREGLRVGHSVGSQALSSPEAWAAPVGFWVQRPRQGPLVIGTVVPYHAHASSEVLV